MFLAHPCKLIVRAIYLSKSIWVPLITACCHGAMSVSPVSRIQIPNLTYDLILRNFLYHNRNLTYHLILRIFYTNYRQDLNWGLLEDISPVVYVTDIDHCNFELVD